MAYDPNSPNSKLDVPKIFRDTSGGTSIMQFNPDTGKYGGIDIVDALFTPEERAGLAKQGYNYGSMQKEALKKFQSQYGIDFNSLPAVNTADLTQRAAEAYGFSRLQDVTGGFTGNLDSLIASYKGGNPTTSITKSIAGSPLGGGKSASGAPIAGGLPQYTIQAPTGTKTTGITNPGAFDPFSAQNLGLAPGESLADFALPNTPSQIAANNLPQPGPITSSTLTSSSSLPYQPAASSPPYPVSTIPTPTPAPLSPTQQSAQDIISTIQGLNTSLEGRSAYQTQQNTQYGVDTAQKTINDLTAQLTGLKNEAAAIPLQLQQGAADRGVTTPLLGAQENSRLRTNAIAALGVSTLLAAAQGQLANAQSLADKAVAQKFDPIQEKITALTNNLNLILNSPQYSEEVKARAQAQLDIQKQKQDALDKAKSNADMVQKVAITAAANQQSFVPNSQFQTATQALQYIQNMTDPIQAQALASQLFPDRSQAQVLGSASTGYFTYNPLTGKTTPVGSPISSTNTNTAQGYQPGQLTQLLQSQGKQADDATLQSLWKQYGNGGAYINDAAHNSIIYSALNDTSFTPAQGWVDLINSGRADITNVPANLKNEVASLLSRSPSTPVTSQYQTDTARRTIAAVDSLINQAVQHPDIFGRSAALPLPDFARSDAFRNFKSELDTLKSNIAFGALNAMREASKTGGALGQISDREEQLLSSTLGALNMSQSPDQIQKQLVKIKESVNRWLSATSQSGGQVSGGKVVTAPDGTQVIITD